LRKSSIALVAAAFVVAIAASLYALSALAHPYWADEETEEGFIPPCWGDEGLIPPGWDGEEYNGTYGYPPEWCLWWNSTDGQPPEGFHPPWCDPDAGIGEAQPRGYGPGNGGGMMWSRGGNGRGGYGASRGIRGYRRGCS
jgi:hypothetical protein